MQAGCYHAPTRAPCLVARGKLQHSRKWQSSSKETTFSALDHWNDAQRRLEGNGPPPGATQLVGLAGTSTVQYLCP